MKTDERITTIADGLDYIDEFLATHGPYLPGHLIDFALDCRSIILRLEAELQAAARAEAA